MINLLSNFFIFVLGLVIGSFTGVCVYRLPRGKSIAFDVSRCDHCRAPLPWPHKLPLVSFLLLRGNSRCCGRPIPRLYPFLEAATGALFLLLDRCLADSTTFLQTSIFIELLAIGMLIDLENRIIPNKVTLTGVGVGLLFAIFAGKLEWWNALLGIFICGGLLYAAGFLVEKILKKPHAMGGGDVKFAAMIGAFLGWQQGLSAALLAAGAGTVFGVAATITRRKASTPVEICFGPFLALGAAANLLWGDWFWQWYFSVML